MRFIAALPRALQIAALLEAFVLPGWQAEAADNNGKYKILGRGGSSCGSWSTDRKNPNSIESSADGDWLQGFVTGFNHFVWHGKDVGSDTDYNGMMAWMDNYCAANPTKNIGRAAENLILFLASGPHLNDK